ncbi:unnamed protein product [Brachionus calyciflorus]|uniref:Uncharacterized protein n=1 Tax=Brachionus calyciflorus TaxID=104777 RepID=A0A813UA76_9BILA|nr:unnamed protein product [Brachionus calyciflorus]
METQIKNDNQIVSKIIEYAIEEVVGDKQYEHVLVNDWVSKIVEKCLNRLKEFYPSFKHIVTCVIMNKNGSGLHSSSSVFWDNTTDGK